MPDILDNLNDVQRLAVTLPPSHALIVAGAGSGKTRVLTTRIAWLIKNALTQPQNILAVTFTNKAAKEMLARLSAMLPISTRSLWVGTFHGLCNRILRIHYRDAALPENFQILDMADQLSAIKRLLKNLNIDDEKYPPRELMYFINAHKEAGIRANAAEADDDYTAKRVALYQEYEAQCQREGSVDFAELLLRSYELLSRHEPLRQHYRERFKHILVDEFQDTNALQYKWLKLFARRDAEGLGGHIFAVGDDDQSIYGFRGAEIGNMRALEREFGIDHVIRLEQNYRSGGNILEAANALIRFNRERLGKNLWTAEGEGEPIRVFEGFSDLDEARFIVDEIQSLVREGHARKNIALLYRANAQSRVLEHELFTRGVPYRVHGGLRFFDRQEIKHALAYLRLIAHPEDDTAFLRIVNFPARGIGTRTVEALQEAAYRANSSLYNAAASMSGRAGAALGTFIRLIETLRVETENLPLPEIVLHLIDKSGLKAHYLMDKEGKDRLDNLDELINAATNFLREDPATPTPKEERPLTAFLTHASLEAGEHQANTHEDAVQLMTVHAAKGLEFNAVFITGLEQGLFPHDNAQNARDGLEEERRLMYVAITRARERLYLSYAQTRLLHGQTRYNLASQFLEEIPKALFRRVGYSAKASGFARPQTDEPAFSTGKFSTRAPEALACGLGIGQNVNHAKFGLGVIVSIEGGVDPRVHVNFKRTGLKILSLQYAKLEPV